MISLQDCDQRFEPIKASDLSLQLQPNPPPPTHPPTTETPSQGVNFESFLPYLVPQKVAVAEKSLRFQIAKCKIASFTAESQHNRQKIAEKNRRKIAAIFWGAEKIAAFQRFQNRCVFQTLSFSVVLQGNPIYILAFTDHRRSGFSRVSVFSNNLPMAFIIPYPDIPYPTPFSKGLRVCMGKMGSICHFPRALPARIWAHCSQVLVFTSIWGTHKKGCDNNNFRAVFPSIWASLDPQTLQNKGKRKMTNRPFFTPHGFTSSQKKSP